MLAKALPTHIISFTDRILCFELSATEWSPNFVCIALQNKLILGIVKFPEESESECFEWNQIKELYHESRCHAIAIAPETSLAVIPKVVIICTAGSDFNLRIFNTDLEDDNTVRILQGHRSYVNQLSWDPEGEYLASVSDDHTCILWKCKEDFARDITFHFKSAVVSAKWHTDEPGKLLVAEKCGTIHLFNVESQHQQSIMSVECAKSPLMYADWALNNSAYVAAMAGGDIVFWDLKKPARPHDIKQIHENAGQIVKFSPHTESIVASIGRPNVTMKVMHAKSQIPQLEAPLLLYCGLSWHNVLPYIAAGQDRKLCFWKIVT